MEYIKKYKYFIIIIIGLIGLNVYLIMHQFNNELTEEVDVDSFFYDVEAEEVVEDEEYSVFVDIKGAVKYPGVYELPSGSRVINVIDLCGGLLENADTSNINMSKKIYDEMMIYVVYKNEPKDDAIINNSVDNQKISINTATEAQLMSLPGIGQSKAQAIIEYRNSNPFKSIEDIINVSGISQSIYEKIKEYITL